MNPRFEFEERLMSGKSLPIEKAKMINLISRKSYPFAGNKFRYDSYYGKLMPTQHQSIRLIKEQAEALSNLKNFNIPTVMSSNYAGNLFKTITDIENSFKFGGVPYSTELLDSYNKATKSITKLKDFYNTTPIYKTPKTWKSRGKKNEDLESFKEAAEYYLDL